MSLGKLQEFTFHMYWKPEEESIEVRHIGSLRPPNELIEQGVEITRKEIEGIKEELSSDHRTYLGKANVAFAYFPSEPEKNRIKQDAGSFESIMRTEESSTPIGDEVAADFEVKHLGEKRGIYRPYQQKGWLELNGEYYNTSDSKPNGWSSR